MSLQGQFPSPKNLPLSSKIDRTSFTLSACNYIHRPRSYNIPAFLEVLLIKQSVDVNEGPDSRNSLKAKSQATLPSYRKADQSSSTSVNDVMNATEKFSHKVHLFGKQHATAEQMLCEDTKATITKIREAKSIYDPTSASELLQFFIHKRAYFAVCPCYKLYQFGKPLLGRLSPLEVQRKLTPS